MTMRQSIFRSLVTIAVLAPMVALGARVLAQTPQRTAPAQEPANVPEASVNDIDGEQMFATSCGFCHQMGGLAAGRGPKLAGIAKSDEYIIERIKKGRPGTMPAYGRAFTDGQIIAILAYIRGLDDSGG
jgi:mono/diheme cytochrome c family protein